MVAAAMMKLVRALVVCVVTLILFKVVRASYARASNDVPAAIGATALAA